MSRSIHPFPARMAPELAIASLADLPPNSVVLDPMVGSGTVIRHASANGHRAVGVDMDPLAVLMSTVLSTPVADTVLEKLTAEVFRKVANNAGRPLALPWIDNDPETLRFVEYWFGTEQIGQLRVLAAILFSLKRRTSDPEPRAAVNVLRLALSRIIITKEQGASLGRDVSHSRPHKVATSSNYDVLGGFARSVRQVRKILSEQPAVGNASISLGDARALRRIRTEEVDFVMTSPPYLNAIDYMRGHRLSLVWLGYALTKLRRIRSRSIGAERGPDSRAKAARYSSIATAMGSLDDLPRRYQLMIARYSEDTYMMMSEVARVLKPNGRAVLVVGNSCLKGVFIRNSMGVTEAGAHVGLRLISEVERELPQGSRYLPTPSEENPLAKRMRTETILTFQRE